MIAIDNSQIDIVTDLYKAGITEDGEDFSAESYYITITYPSGRRFAHTTTFYGADAIENEDGFSFFVDIRNKAKADVNRLYAQIIAKGTINEDYWVEIEPVYGSPWFIRLENNSRRNK